MQQEIILIEAIPKIILVNNLIKFIYARANNNLTTKVVRTCHDGKEKL